MKMKQASSSTAGYSPPDHQRRVDEIQAAIRAEAATPAKPSLFRAPPERPGPSDDPLDQRMAEELECVRRHVEQLGAVLANNPMLVSRHSTQLQSIDLVSQVLGHLSRIVAAKNKELAVEQVSMRELRSRLQRKPLAPLFQSKS
jgi:uncharacterized coiled-coil protein SlyX